MLKVLLSKPRGGAPDPYWDPIRDSMGHAAALAGAVHLAAMTPTVALCSTRHCLADQAAGSDYVVYTPTAEPFTVDLTARRGPLSVRWLGPAKGAATDAGTVPGGAVREFRPPFGSDAVLHLSAR